MATALRSSVIAARHNTRPNRPIRRSTRDTIYRGFLVKNTSFSSLIRLSGAVAFAFGIVTLTPAASFTAAQSSTSSTHAAPTPEHFGTWRVDLSAMDRTIKRGDDFDKFVNGSWSRKTEIPADQPSTGVGYDVFNLSQAQIRAIIEHAPPTSQLGAMYGSFMNEAAVEALDDKPLRPDLKRVTAIADKDAFTKFMGETNGAFGIALFGPGVAPDTANPTINTLF